MSLTVARFRSLTRAFPRCFVLRGGFRGLTADRLGPQVRQGAVDQGQWAP
jgi:hypothetical protein